MSRYAKLIINDQEADVFNIEQLPLNLKQRITNESGETAGTFSRSTIKVPATKTNKAILEGELGYLPFRIEVNGATRLSGLLQQKGSDISSDCYRCVKDNYELALFAGNSDWFLSLRDCRLSELTDIVTTYDETPISDGFDADPLLQDFGFFFMKFREWENSRVVTEPNLGGGGNTPRLLESPSYYESTPFLFIYPLVIEAFRKVGYAVESTFLETDFFRRLILPVPLPDKLPEEFNEQYLNFRGDKDIINITTLTGPTFRVPYIATKLPPQNPTVWDAIQFEYTCPEDGFYEVEIGATYGPQTGTFSFVYVNLVTINGVGITKADGGAGWGDGGLLGTFPFPTGESRSDSSVFKLNAGDVIASEVIVTTDTDFDIINSFMRINGEALRAEGLTIDFKTLIAKEDFIPMFKDLVTLFKLGVETDNQSKKVFIEPLDPYLYTDRLTSTKEVREGYYSLTDFKDYSGLIDFKQKVEGKVTPLEGFLKYIWKSDEDETTVFREEGNRLAIYEAIYNSPSGSDKNKKKEFITDFFAKSVHILDAFARYPETNITPQFVLSYPFNYVQDPTATAEDANYDISPRILYFGGQRGGIDGYIEINEAQEVAEELPAAFMVNYNDTSGLDPVLSFSNVNIGGRNIEGLVERFHVHCIARLRERGTKKASICSNSIDRDNFTFRQRGVINGKKYIVENVESVNPLQNTPDRFLFVLDALADQSIIDAIENSNLSGLFSVFVEP